MHSNVTSLPSAASITSPDRLALLTRAVALILGHAPAGAGLARVLEVVRTFGRMIEMAIVEGLDVEVGAHALASLSMFCGFRESTEQSQLRSCDALTLGRILAFVESRPGPAIDLVRMVSEVKAGSRAEQVIAIRLLQFVDHYGIEASALLAPAFGLLVDAEFRETDATVELDGLLRALESGEHLEAAA